MRTFIIPLESYVSQMRYIFRPGLFDYDNDIEKVMPTTLVKTC